MKRPTISVVIPTYNRSATLPRAMDSVIAQTLDDWELVVVDDGSEDDTPNILDAYRQKLSDRFISIRQRNLGCGAARNRGIEHCRGRFVAFLDSDDEFLPQKLARQMELFAACPELIFVYGDYSFVDLTGESTQSAIAAKFPLARTVPSRGIGAGLYVMGPELFETLLRGYFIATIVGLVRREALSSIRFHERLSYAEEWLFYLRLARQGRAGYVDEPLAVHHFTENSLTRSDKHRNLVRQCELFCAMKKEFLDLVPRERAIVNDHLARSHAQLAGSYRRDGKPLKALLTAGKSYIHNFRSGSRRSRRPLIDQVRIAPAR